jgi:capsular exopolysaccharide synthesis family protein
MSRILDALRQSEKDKQPGAENWSKQIPGMYTTAPDLSLSDESADESANESSRPILLPDEESHDFSFSPLPATFVPRAINTASPIDLSELKVIPVESIQSQYLVALNHERELGAEKFRVLGARLSNIRQGATLNILQVTSSVVGEGKTLTSVNLAMTLAKRFAQKVVLVEGDLRKPAVCAMLGLTNRLGIGDWWQEQDTPIGDFLLRIGDTGMCLLPAGNAVHPASVLQSPRLPEMLSELTRQFDWVIIDTPPLLPMADSNQWSRVADGTLFVVRKGAVSRAALKKAVESIDNPKLVGIVFNDASDYDRVNYYDQYYTPRTASDSAERKADAH